MGRLIDADKLIEEMRKWYFDSEKQKAAEQDCSPMDLFTNLAITTVYEHPTAYDPDKVMEQLKSVAYEQYGNEGMGGQKVVALDDAIEIMRGDREPEPECEWKLEDAEGNLYAIGCENRQLIFEGTPEENGYKYCPYCGKRIKEVE